MKNNCKNRKLFKIRLKNRMKKELNHLIGEDLNDADLKSVIMDTGLKIMKEQFSDEVIPHFEKKVVNGCNGSCCTEFTFPYMPEELNEMIQAQDQEKEYKGKFITYPKTEMEKIRDMLIFLHETDICPQEKRTFKSIIQLEGIENLTNELVKEKAKSGDFYKVKDNNILAKVFTCKHFDKVNKICNDYENRPDMCKRFGGTCKYEGCCFVENKEKEYQKVKENLKASLTDYSELSA